MNRSRIERAGAIAIAVAVLGFALLTQVLGGPSESVDGSITSTGDDGRRALFLLFGELGYAPESWRKFPGALPSGEHVLMLASAPRKDDEIGAEESGEEKKPSGEHAPAPAGLEFRSLMNYRRFVESGGTLVLPASKRALEFLTDDLECEPCREIAIDTDSKPGPRVVRTSTGAQWKAQWKHDAAFAELDPASDVRELWWGNSEDGAEDERLAVQVPLGNGRIVVLGDDRFLDNKRIGELDHALLAVSLFEELSHGGRLLFDEYALGLLEASTPLAIATGPSLVLASAHVLLLLALLVWRAAWPLRFPRDPVPLAQASPIMRARSLASVFERAGRVDALMRHLRTQDALDAKVSRRRKLV